METDQPSPRYELKNELARLCLPEANRDTNLKLAWVNSVCLLFLIIGMGGARRGLIVIKPPPPLAEAVPVIMEPITLPPQETVKNEKPEDARSDAPLVNVVIPQSPSINFSVPTIGSVVALANLAEAPPLEPMQTAAHINSLTVTGEGGERPEPPYPTLAKETGEQGTVVLLLGGDAAGNVISAEVKASSGFPIIDRASVEFIKRHWHLPAGDGNRLFQVPITYKLQLN